MCREYSSNDHWLAFLHSDPCTYIRMVQCLIERCLILRMSREECVEALARHARIKPLVTITVWRELLKENLGFFQAYFHATSSRSFRSKHMVVRRYHPTRFARKRSQWRRRSR